MHARGNRYAAFVGHEPIMHTPNSRDKHSSHAEVYEAGPAERLRPSLSSIKTLLGHVPDQPKHAFVPVDYARSGDCDRLGVRRECRVCTPRAFSRPHYTQ